MRVKLKYKIPIFTVVVGLLFSSCKKDILDINTNPNSPSASTLTADLVLPNALQATAALYNNPTAGDSYFGFVAIWFGHMSYSGNYAISTNLLSYQLTNTFATGNWYSLYDNNNDYKFIESQGLANKNPFYRAIGKLMKAYNFETLVDLYNDVPYTQALQGTNLISPAYDKGQDVYKAIGLEMDTAISLLGTSVTGSIKGDILFSGDATKWLAFANTLKLRFLVQQSARTDIQAYLTAEFAKLKLSTATTAFITTDAGVNPGYLTATGKQSPIWSTNYNASGQYSQDFYRAGAYSVKFLQTHNDTLRLKAIYSLPASPTSTTASGYAGNLFGDPNPLVNSKTSGFGPGILKAPTQSAILMLLAESYFLQAEAVVRGYMTGDAQALYQSGVSASFNYLLGSSTGAAAYYSQSGDKQVNFATTTTTAEKLAIISRQFWVAEDMVNELEFYNTYRRNGYPSDIPLSLNTASTGVIPNRLLYPQTELNNNATKVPTGVTSTSKVWWMP